MSNYDPVSTLVFFVNGIKVEDNEVEPEWTLLYYLRNKLRLCGTKLGCGEGGCGACTVMVSKMDRLNNQIQHIPVNACLAPVCSMHGLAVTTVEGIGSTQSRLHPAQERIAKAHGSQCGFCTPGFVMSMYTLLRSTEKPSLHDLETAFQGNLCRCTGYRPIIEGYKTFVCPMGENCCRNVPNGVRSDSLFDRSQFVPLDPTQEPIFPPELALCSVLDSQYVFIKGANVTWHRPTNFSQLLALKQQFPNAKLVVGNTEVGVEVKFKNMLYPVIINPVMVPELTVIERTANGVRFGAAVTLDRLEHYLRQIMSEESMQKTRVFRELVDMLQVFAGKQIRCVGAIGGNVMTASPISDFVPILLAARAHILVCSASDGPRTLHIDDKFFTGYRKTALNPNEILQSIVLPFTKPAQHFCAYKQARRREDDIAIVNMAMWVSFRANTILELRLAFGGMSFKTVTAPITESALKGKPWTYETLELAYGYLQQDLPLSATAPGGMVRYRRSLTLSLFHKAFLKIANERPKSVEIPARHLSAIASFSGKSYQSSQYFSLEANPHLPNGRIDATTPDALFRPIVHSSAIKQATGEALYCDDIPRAENESYLAFVISRKAHARIIDIDWSEAQAATGVIGTVCASDLLPEHNCYGSVVHDEKIFYNDIVTSQGQIIGAILACDQLVAQKAAKLVKVQYEDISPVIITIEDAIKYQSFFGVGPRVLKTGDFDALKAQPGVHVIDGECRMGGQEHFYLETQSVFAIPKGEDGEMDVFCSTQHPSEISAAIAEMLGVYQNKIITKVKRIGGGFGGKESRAMGTALVAALAAHKYKRPVRCMLDRDEDMQMTGGRHPFYARYSVVCDDAGKLLGCGIKMYANCGHSHDLSMAVVDRAISHFENSYRIPIVAAEGYACKTNLPSNTAFRGFGGPQGMFMAEMIMCDIAFQLGKNVLELRELNLYKEGDLTYYNQQLTNCTVDRCWSEVIQTSDYRERRAAADQFNEKNRYKKRGLSVIPTKYGIAFTIPILNQAGALVLVYTDGSVLLSHGGIEMGQGLHTKMIQVATKVLGISMEKIHIIETATDKVPNTSPTAASSGSDLNGMAVMKACQTIIERLQPYREQHPDGPWEKWVKCAYGDRVSLAATGFYKTPDIGYNWDTGEGQMYNYFTYGAAVGEVEIDTLTGDHQVLRIDIVMDLGNSLNPAIDIGQIEGAYMQGYGLFVMEELVYSPDGTLFTRGPGTYKLPALGDIPQQFNVTLLKGVSNPRAVFSSKAVGEPPLFLGSSVFFAIRDAIQQARKEHGLHTNFRLDAPATAERIRMACQDHLTDLVEDDPKPGTYKPWNVVV